MAVATKHGNKMNNAERKFAAMAASVFSEARRKHEELGHTILVSQGNNLIRITSDGLREVVKRIASPRVYKPGTKISLR